MRRGCYRTLYLGGGFLLSCHSHVCFSSSLEIEQSAQGSSFRRSILFGCFPRAHRPPRPPHDVACSCRSKKKGAVAAVSPSLQCTRLGENGGLLPRGEDERALFSICVFEFLRVLPLVAARTELRLLCAVTSVSGRHIEKLATFSGRQRKLAQRAAGVQRLRTRVSAFVCLCRRPLEDECVSAAWKLACAAATRRRNESSRRRFTRPGRSWILWVPRSLLPPQVAPRTVR